MGDAMSLLQNPEFESGQWDPPWAPWKPRNAADSVDLEVVYAPPGRKARSGSRYLKFITSKPHGSVAQDIKVTMPSVTALAYVRAESGEMTGSLTITDLEANPDNQISYDFAVGETWTQVIAVLGMKTTGANRPVRVEFKLTTTNKYLHIDSVTAF
jgi:hypothetical protein